MIWRRGIRRLLRERDVVLMVPPNRRVRDMRHLRIERLRLPNEVTASLGHAGPGTMLVDLARTLNRAAFSYGSTGWHPYVAALREHLQRPDLPYPDSVLAAFYARFQPRTVHDLLLYDGVRRATLDSWPAVDRLIDVWSAQRGDVLRTRARPADPTELPHSQYRGPTNHEFGARHLYRVVTAYESFREHGYRPELFDSGFVTGYFLTRGDDYRFVVGHGNHRLAALSVLGERNVTVTLRPTHPPVVDASALHRWTTPHGGLFEPHESRALHDRFFAEDSVSRASNLGFDCDQPRPPTR